MNFHVLLIVAAVIGRSSQLTLNDCATIGQARRPAETDIAVTCGTESIDLAIQACPVVYTGYNESLLILNRMTGSGCEGTLDLSVSPPVVRFSFPLNNTHACGSNFRTTDAQGTGALSDFSNIQTVNISGMVRSSDPTTGTITYNAELKYFYSCAYPLSYLINNTQIDVSANSIALEDKNGSFVSTLRIELFNDSVYATPLVMPQNGVELRTEIFVEVKATNLTAQYNVLLERCYASISPHPANSTFFNLFVPCQLEPLTTMIQNGVSQSARFSFKAFRFMEQQNEMVSTYYLHCITRLCDDCSTFMSCSDSSGRRRRSADERDVSEPHTITSPEIVTQTENSHPLSVPVTHSEHDGSLSTSVGAAVGVLVFVCIVALCVAAVFYKKLKN